MLIVAMVLLIRWVFKLCTPSMIDKETLFVSYPSLRVAYIDEVEEPSKDRSKKIEKVYYSALVKAAVTKPDDPGQKLDQVP